MRKILLSLGVAAIAAGALTSCGNKDSKKYTEDQIAFGDSIANSFGEFAAADQLQRYQRMQAFMSEEQKAKFSKADFLAGLKAVLDVDTNRVAYYQGIQMGLQMMQPISFITNDYDLPVDANKVYEAFKKVYMMDSITDPNEYMMTYQEVSTKLQARAREIEAKKIRESKEYKTNTEAGEAYAKEKVAEGYTKSPSGIVYKIENPGTGEKVQPTDKVAIHYKGMKTDGTVFDETKEKPYESSASVFVPGFNEALSLLAKGGKMTVVIPGELAYGETGAGDFIGPNETLVFDIEVVDVTPRTTTATGNAAAPVTIDPQQVKVATK